LAEVVIIGYGSVERKNLTSSVSLINDKQLKDIPINSAAQALAGRLAGVQVTASEGSPNADVRVRVRGGMSITGDNSPLYVVDGIQVENALSVLAPQDIESVTVLKDASANAIYGSRGANGVVLITTKSGKKGKTVVAVSSLLGVRQLANKLDVWKPADFVRYQYDRSRGSTVNESGFLKAYGSFEDIDLYNDVPFVDWQEQIFGRNAMMSTNNVSINGGTQATSVSLSLTSNKEEGVMLGSDFDRKLINLKLDHEVNKKVKVGFNVRYNNTVVNGAGTSTPGSSSVNRLRHSIKYRPFLSVAQSLDSYDRDYAQETNSNSLSLVNPILLTKQEYQKQKSSTVNFSGNVAIDITEFLNFRSTAGVDIFGDQIYMFNDTITNASKSNGGGQPIASIDTKGKTIFNNSNVLSFTSSGLKNFPSSHKVDVLLGQEIYSTDDKRNFQENKFFPIGITPKLAFGSMQLGAPQPTSFTRESQSRLASFFTRASYNYNDRYLATFSVRADGSSKFSENRRWGYFPAGSLMWKMHNESFMQGLTSTLNELKFRVSYGTSANNRIPDYSYLDTFIANAYYSINNNQVIGYEPSLLANDRLKWEATVSRNVGIDAAFLGGKLQFSVDYYLNTSKDLLIGQNIPTTSGYKIQTQNRGKTSNKGVEIQLSGTPYNRGDFRYDANFNISFNKNKIVNLGDQESFLVSSNWAGSNQPADYKVIVGQPVGTIWGLITDGYYQVSDFDYNSGTGMYTLKAGVPSNQGITSIAPQPGVIKFQDYNEDGIVNDADRTVIGNTSPKFFGGLNQTLAYKNFDLSVFINFQVGNDVLNANKLEFTSGYTVNSNLLATMSNRFTNVNSEGAVVTDPAALEALNSGATIWSPLTTAASFYVHSWAVEKGSFARINNISLGYSLPQNILNKLRLTKFRIYGTVNNLAVFTKYSGYDPEVNTRKDPPLTPGVDYSAYPRSKGYIVGFNLTF
jgi:TonB-dependent starch-binding outer membrane protein SusC